MAFNSGVPDPFFSAGAAFFLLPNIAQGGCGPIRSDPIRSGPVLPVLWPQPGSVLSCLAETPRRGGERHGAADAAPHAFITEEEKKSQAKPLSC